MTIRTVTNRLATVASSRTFWLWALTSLAIIYLIFFGIFALFYALNQGAYFNGYAADGPFQLYNPLRRMAAGQIAGYDFPFFHGIGIPLLHYIPFRLLGGNLFASEVVRWLLSPSLFVASSLVFFYAMLQSRRKTIIATALLTITALAYSDVVLPSNSLLGVRTTFPMLAAAALMWPSTKTIGIRRYGPIMELRHVIAIICLIIAFLCGTEQGIAAIIAYLVVRTVSLLREQRTIWSLVRPAVEGLLIVAGILLMLTIITLGRPFKPLVYALISIPQEQAWYFGSPPNYYLSGEYIWPFLSSSFMYPSYILLVLGSIAFVLARRRNIVTSAHATAAILLSIYGLLTLGSLLGYFSPLTQFFPATRIAMTLLAGVAVATVFDERVWKSLQAVRQRRKSRGSLLKLGLIAAPLLMGGYISYSAVRTATEFSEFQLQTIVNLSRAAYRDTDSIALTPEYKEAVNGFKPEIVPGADVWSTYSNIYESNAGIFVPADDGQDYIIHALGEHDREAYNQQFVNAKTDYAITLRPSYFPYEEWLWTKTWPFYRQLLTNYTLTKENNMHYLWKYSGGQTPVNAWENLRLANNEYRLPGNRSERPKLYEVKVTYNIPVGLPLLNKLPRHFIESSGTAMQYAASLPPYEQEWVIPVFLTPGQTRPNLQMTLKGILPGASIDVGNIQYRELVLPTKNYQPFIENWCTSAIGKTAEYCRSLRP